MIIIIIIIIIVIIIIIINPVHDYNTLEATRHKIFIHLSTVSIFSTRNTLLKCEKLEIKIPTSQGRVMK